MSDLREAAKLALIALENGTSPNLWLSTKENLRQALAQPEQGRLREITREFVGVKEDGSERWVETEYRIVTNREWVGLTDAEVEAWRGNYDFF